MDYVDMVKGHYVAFLADSIIAVGYGAYYEDELLRGSALELSELQVFQGDYEATIARFLQENFPYWVLLEGIDLDADYPEWSWKELKLLRTFLDLLNSDLYAFDWAYQGASSGGQLTPEWLPMGDPILGSAVDGALRYLAKNSADIKALSQLFNGFRSSRAPDVTDNLLTAARTYSSLPQEARSLMFWDCLEELRSLADQLQRPDEGTTS